MLKYDSRKAAEELKKEYDRIRCMAYLMIAMVAAVILVSALRKFWLTLLFIAVTVFFQLFVFRKMQKSYEEHAVQENIKAAVGQLLHTDQVVMKGDELLPEEVIRGAALVPVMGREGAINRFAAVSGYSGTKDRRMEVTSCDVSLAMHQPGTKISAQIECGNWIHIRMPEDSGYHFTVSGDKIRDEQADPESEGSVRLPERFYRQLEKLEGYTTGTLLMRVSGDTADVFLKARFLAGRFSARSEVTEKMIEWNPLPELEKVLDLVWILI